MKLSEYAKNVGVTYQTVFRWFQSGKIKNSYKTDSGSIFVSENNIPTKDKIVIYARVSNQSRRKEMEYQVDRIKKFSEARGYIVEKIYKEVASGMNNSRVQLWRMIDYKPTKIIIENKDRLARFGFEYLKRLLLKQGTEIICMNNDESEEDDLMKDMIAIITSFCCRLYGTRRGKNKSNKIKEVIDDIKQQD